MAHREAPAGSITQAIVSHASVSATLLRHLVPSRAYLALRRARVLRAHPNMRRTNESSATCCACSTLRCGARHAACSCERCMRSCQDTTPEAAHMTACNDITPKRHMTSCQRRVSASRGRRSPSCPCNTAYDMQHSACNIQHATRETTSAHNAQRLTPPTRARLRAHRARVVDEELEKEAFG